jgi:hypothetical protein
MKIGRNDPCPRGSGRKYKNCCLEDQGSGLPGEGPAGVFAEIRQALEGREFSSLEELRSFTDRFMRRALVTVVRSTQRRMAIWLGFIPRPDFIAGSNT